MRDDLFNQRPDEGRPRERRPADGAPPPPDREVPLPQEAGTLPIAIHRWLDGELPEAAARKADGGASVMLWRRLDDELRRRSRMRTPPSLPARIMAALPNHAPTMISPWWRRELVVTPGTVLGGAAALVALTALLTSLLAHAR
jgi:hypothetical protein